MRNHDRDVAELGVGFDPELDEDIDEAALHHAGARLARRPWPAVPLRQPVRASFEFFPPASAEKREKLVAASSVLTELDPAFVSVTYGAGGSSRDRSFETIKAFAAIDNLPVAAHLTCVDATRAEVDRVIDDLFAHGVRHIVALRGDPPVDARGMQGYASAAELVKAVKERAERHAVDIEVSVAAYPETHPKAASARADLDNLKQKFDAGADRAITQFFFDPEVGLRFIDRARRSGIVAPIVPGIMPIASFEGVCRFAERCGATIPFWLTELFRGLDDVPEVRQTVAATVAAEQIRILAEHGVADVHLYTMNQPLLSAATCRVLGLRSTGRVPYAATVIA